MTGGSGRHPGARIQVRKPPTKPKAPGTANAPRPVGSGRSWAGARDDMTQCLWAGPYHAPKGENSGLALQYSLGQTRPGHDR